MARHLDKGRAKVLLIYRKKGTIGLVGFGSGHFYLLKSSGNLDYQFGSINLGNATPLVPADKEVNGYHYYSWENIVESADCTFRQSVIKLGKEIFKCLKR